MEVAHQASHSALGEWHVEDVRRVGWRWCSAWRVVGHARKSAWGVKTRTVTKMQRVKSEG